MDKKQNPQLSKAEISASSVEKGSLESPKDKYRIIYGLFFLLGLVHYLPFSFFTTAIKFWMYKFRNTSLSDYVAETHSELRTDLQAEFNAALKITLQVSDIAFLVLTLLFGHYIKVRTRLVGVISIITFFFFCITVFVKVDTDSWQSGFFALVMAFSSGINAMNAVFSISMFSIISHFPHVYLSAYLLGGGLSGIFTSSLQILSLSLGLSTIDSALVYFSVGFGILLFALIALIATGNNEYYVYHMRHSDKSENKETQLTFKEGYHLLKKIWSSVLMMGMFLLSVDASPTALIVSEGEGNGPWNDTYFIPCITYLLAAVMGLIGRGLSFILIPKLNSVSWCLLAALRVMVFVPLLMLCNAQPRNHLPVLFPHDYQYIVISIFNHLTGGYLMSRISYNIVNLVKPEELKKAYHVNMLFGGFWMGALSFVGIVSVKLL